MIPNFNSSYDNYSGTSLMSYRPSNDTHFDEFSTWMFCFNNVKEYFVIRKHICSTKNSLFLVKDVSMTNVYLSPKNLF